MNESFGPLEAALAQDPGWSPSPEGAEAAAALPVAATEGQVKEEELDNATPPEPKEDDAVQSVSSSTTSSSASDCSAMGSDLEGVLAEWSGPHRQRHGGESASSILPGCTVHPGPEEPRRRLWTGGTQHLLPALPCPNASRALCSLSRPVRMAALTRMKRGRSSRTSCSGGGSGRGVRDRLSRRPFDRRPCFVAHIW